MLVSINVKQQDLLFTHQKLTFQVIYGQFIIVIVCRLSCFSAVQRNKMLLCTIFSKQNKQNKQNKPTKKIKTDKRII